MVLTVAIKIMLGGVFFIKQLKEVIFGGTSPMGRINSYQ
jgi:hypothetical protein